VLVTQRPLRYRVANTFTPLNLVAAGLLLVLGVQLSRVLITPRFGFTLVILAMLAAIPMAMTIIVRPRFGVVLVFILSMVIIEIKRLAWTLEVGLMMEGIEGVLAGALALAILTRRDLWRLSSRLNAAVLLYLFYQVLISFHPNLPSIFNVIYSLRDVLNTAVPFFAALYLVRDRQQLHRFLFLWLGTAALIALYGLKQHYLGLTGWESAWLSISLTHVLYGQVRIFSTLGSADALGMHMAISIVVALAVALHTGNPKIKYPALALVPIFVVANMYTLTRGAYVAVLVGVLALAVITRTRGLILVVIISAALAIGWYQANQGSLLANRVMTMFAPEQDESYAVRQNYIEKYSPLIFSNPIGLGPATSGRQGGVLLAASGIDPALLQSLAGVPTDNYYFRIALEYGWIGLLIFLVLLAAAFWVGLRIYLASRDPLVKWVAAAFLASYAAMALASLSNNYFAAPDLKLFFWFSLGVLANLPLIESGAEETAEVESTVPRLALAGVGRRW
jgi:hypothetical protein